MSKGSILRQMKRKAMREAGLTFKERMNAAMATGKAVPGVGYKALGKKIVAELMIRR